MLTTRVRYKTRSLDVLQFVEIYIVTKGQQFVYCIDKTVLFVDDNGDENLKLTKYSRNEIQVSQNGTVVRSNTPNKSPTELAEKALGQERPFLL